MIELIHLLSDDPSPEKAGDLLQKFNLPYTKTVVKNLKQVWASISLHENSERLVIAFLDQIKNTSHPVQALNQAERFFSQLDAPEETLRILAQETTALRVLCTLFGASPYLSSILIQKPERFLWLMGEQAWNHPAQREPLLLEILEACRGIDSLQETYPLFRQVKQREMLRIGARDLTGFADFTETVEALTSLAEASLEAAYRVVDRFIKRRYGTPQVEDAAGALRECAFSILGMGKLGGMELNFSSDIDLLYLYESSQGETTGISNGGGGTTGRVENHIYFVKLCEGITDLLHANTEDGFVFRVDLRLRPEGAHGPVASSLRSLELYYESFGQTWERAALMKCRPVAGDPTLGKAFEKMIRPFIYRKYLDYAAIDEIKEMKRKILQELGRRPSRGVNIKLDRGGIREIEFFIQALQLIYGGRISWVRERNSLRALHRLCDKKLITYEDYSTLSKAYLFLRDVEHKLQIENQLQIQTLPTKTPKLEQLARRCGLPDRKALLAALDRCRDSVQACFENLFYEQEEAEAVDNSSVYAILRGEAEQDETHNQLSKLGFQDPRRAYKNIELLRDGAPYAHTSSRSRTLFWKIAPTLMHEISTSPDPDMALNHLERFVSGYGAREVFYGLLEETPTALRRVITLFSTSSYFSNLLIRHPEYVDTLFVEDLTGAGPSSHETLHSLMKDLQKAPTPSAKIDGLRRFKHLEEMKIGLREMLMDADLMNTSRSLSRLADACLEAAYRLALEELSEAHGTPRTAAGHNAGIAVLGAGKLGAEELTYGSDLDLLFVYSEDGETTGPDKISNPDFFSRVAGRVAAILSTMTSEGTAYRVDLRLRPLGESGPLVQSLEGFRDYFKRSLQPWERQAYTKIRHSAGDKKTGEGLLDLIIEALFQTPPQPGLNHEVLEMRLRIEKEKAQPSEGLLFFKTGAGGLIDIEFLVQYLQLRYGHERPELRSPKTFQVLETAQRMGILSQEDGTALTESYLFLRRLESRIRIVQDRPITALSSDPEKNRALALRMGYSDGTDTSPGEQLLHDYHATTRKTRAIFLRLLGDRESGSEKTPSV